VQVPGSILARMGSKQVGRVVSVEHATTTTVVCAVSASGNGSDRRSTVENSCWCAAIKCLCIHSCVHIACAFIQGE